MRNFRKKRRPGNRPPTPAEAERMGAARETCCIPCLVWCLLGRMPEEMIATVCGYDHKKSGNIRRGHAFGFGSCDWHHQRLLSDGCTFAGMTAAYGPSLMDGSRLFRETYGDNDSLIELQTRVLTHGLRAVLDGLA